MSPTIQDPILQLDLQLLYLRKVHALCYYSAEEYDDERMLAAKCGPVYLRSSVRLNPIQLNDFVNTKIFEERINTYVNSRLGKGPAKLLKVRFNDTNTQYSPEKETRKSRHLRTSSTR